MVDEETRDGILERRRKANIVIKQLREHQEEVENQKDEAIDCRSEVLKDHFKKSEANLGKSETVDQALLDAQIFHQLGEYSKRQAAQLQTGLQTYDVKTYTDNLVLLMQDANEDALEGPGESATVLNFHDLGNSVWQCWLTIPSIDFMHGNGLVGEVTRAEKKKVRRAKKGVIAVKPSELKSHEVEQTETDRQVAEMRKELAKRKQCNYWIFVIDPNSYTRSIENVFHSSFLVKDTLAALDLKMEPPMIRYLDPEKRREAGAGDETGAAAQKHSQFILGFDRNVWHEVTNKYNIRRCLLPSKPLPDRNDVQLQRLRQLEAEEQTASF